MPQYKLLIDTDDDVVGTIVTLTNVGTIYTSLNTFYSKHYIENNPDKFMKIIPQQHIYPIIVSFIDEDEFIYYLNNDKQYDNPSGYNTTISLNAMMQYVNDDMLTIHQIAVSEDEIYTVGETTKQGMIQKFYASVGISSFLITTQFTNFNNVNVSTLKKLTNYQRILYGVDVASDITSLTSYYVPITDVKFIETDINISNTITDIDYPIIVSFIDEVGNVYYLENDDKYEFEENNLSVADMLLLSLKTYQVAISEDKIYTIGQQIVNHGYISKFEIVYHYDNPYINIKFNDTQDAHLIINEL